MNKPLCFVLMPFGEKKDANGVTINFNAVYKDMIEPAITAAGLEPIRADEEKAGGMIHKAMFERLLLCEYAVADLTTANANVFYELGVRHAARSYKTILIFDGKMQLPFDLNMLRALPYQLDNSGTLVNPETDMKNLKGKLEQIKNETFTDSPLFQLFKDELKPHELDSRKTDIFREQVLISEQTKEKLTEARNKGLDAVKKAETDLGNLRDVESGILIDLFLSYRAVKGWKEMIALVEKMPPPLAQRVMIREQLALALNRDNQDEKAEKILLEVIQQHGPSSETYGLLGRVYKDRWNNAAETASKTKLRGLLNQAVDCYVKGFETDWRDAYPGINALTLMELKDTDDERKTKLHPVVTYAAERKMETGTPDYWGYATMLELAVLGNDEEAAEQWLIKTVTAVREKWEPETTARNMRLIAEARKKRNEDTELVEEIADELMEAAKD